MKTLFLSKTSYLLNPIAIGTSSLLAIIFLFLLILFCIFIFIICYLIYKRGRAEKAGKLRNNFESLIEKAIFFEDAPAQNKEESPWMPIPQKFESLLKKPFDRQVMMDEIINMKKNLSGTAADNLQKLYEQLELKKDSLRKLEYSYWHIKAKGIQELSWMNQKDCLLKIYKLTNHKNELVRMEAQSAIINFSGFEGLRFLDIVSYPLLPWQQLKLLDQLSKIPSESFTGIEQWLGSGNDTVVMFALRLVRIYHRFELHNAVAECLKHPVPAVRKCTVETLAHIYTGDTAALLLNNYDAEDKAYQLAVLDALGEMGTPENLVSFLIKEFGKEDNEIKMAAAKAILAAESGEGTGMLESYPNAPYYPWNEIIQQLKAEKAA